jgi:hypothetical protein
MMAECSTAEECPQGEAPRCDATCSAGVCGIACDTSVPANGPQCPADTSDPSYCDTACSFFALCALNVCEGLDAAGYVPLFQGCVERQCGQAGLICIQQDCGTLITVARGFDMEFNEICTDGLPAE